MEGHPKGQESHQRRTSSLGDSIQRRASSIKHSAHVGRHWSQETLKETCPSTTTPCNFTYMPTTMTVKSCLISLVQLGISTKINFGTQYQSCPPLKKSRSMELSFPSPPSLLQADFHAATFTYSTIQTIVSSSPPFQVSLQIKLFMA